MPEHVLVVEDDEDIRLMLQAGLEMEGYSLSFAGDGLEALELLATITPSIMLLDLGLPRMNGYALLEALEQQRPDLPLPVIIITADTRAAAKLAQKAVKLVPKPFSLYSLFTTIRETLTSAREGVINPHIVFSERGNGL